MFQYSSSILFDSLIPLYLTKIVAPKFALEHAEHNGMKMKTSFPVLLTLKANKEEE